MDECCERCRFFNARTKRPRKGLTVRYGTCQRFPPMRLVTGNDNEWVPAG